MPGAVEHGYLPGVSAESTLPRADRRREIAAAALGVLVLLCILVVGLLWAKWTPYLAEAEKLAVSRHWSGAALLVPEYAVVVLGLGLVSATASDFGAQAARLGLAALILAAVLATLLVVPTGGEIPVILAALAAGAGTGMTGVLLVALPALSLPSAVMVGRALGWRATVAAAGAVAIAALASGALLTALS